MERTVQWPALLKAVGVGAAVSAASAWYLNRRQVSCATDKRPKDWLEIGHVDQLFVYPLKSGAAIRCTELKCTEQGPEIGENRDRILAVVRAKDGTLVTGRDLPHLTQVRAEFTSGTLTLTAPQQPSFQMDLSFLEEKKATTQNLIIWKNQSCGVDCGDEAAGYLTAYLGEPVRLLIFPHKNQGKSVYEGFLDMLHINPVDGGIFSDAMSFHLVNKASVEDLNKRLETPVDGRNFRPNIIIAGEKLLPYEEDSWQWIKIGDVLFRRLAPCTRCLLTTVNPDNGEKSSTFEPLKTLRGYRVLRDPAAKARFGSSPVMGAYLGLRGSEQSVIHEGDAISIGIN